MSTSGGAAGGSSVASTFLDAAAIATSHSVPVELLPAPGAGYYYDVHEIIGEMKCGVCGFAGSPTPQLVLGPDEATGLVISGPPFTPLWVSGQVPFDTLGYADAIVAGTSGVGIRRSQIENKALTITASGADVDRAGPIVTATKAVGGAGYAVNDTGTIDTDPLGYTGGATYKVLTRSGLGEVLTFQVTGAGDGYSTISNPLTTTPGGAQPGIGAGFTVNVTAIHAADGFFFVTVLYDLATLH